MTGALTQQLGLALAVLGVGTVALLCGIVVVLISRNTRLKAAADEERELARFRQLADATFSGVFVYRDNIILDVNGALCRFMGCEPSDLIGHEVGECVAPYDRERLVQRMQSSTIENEEFDVIIKSGATRTVEVITRIVDYRGGS